MGNFHDIRRKLGGDDEGPWSIIHKGKIIVGLCLREDLNPMIHAATPEVWIGDKEPLPIWAERLANDTGPIPVYVSPAEGADYSLKGIFEISCEKPSPEYFDSVKAKAKKGLCRIVFLKMT